MKLNAWFIASRPKTLTASFIPVLVGSALAYRLANSFSIFIFICAFFSTLCIQIATNFINDVLDFEKGADTQERIGPTRVIQSGLLNKDQVRNVAFVLLVLATIFGLPLVIKGGLPILLIGLCSLLFAYAYTGGPYPLAYTGLGDIFVLIFFGIVAVSGTFYLHTDYWSISTVAGGMSVGLLATALIAINNLRDNEQDKKANKRTFAVRFGEKIAKAEIILIICCAYISLLHWRDCFVWAEVLPLLTLPFAGLIIFKLIKTKPSREYNSLLASSGVLHLLFGSLLALGLIIK